MRRRRKYLWVVLILGLLLAAAGFGTYLLPRLPAGSSEMLHRLNPWEHRVQVEKIIGEHDQDGDGIFDADDIVQGAREYVETRPKYRDGYYAGGYPPAGEGVCTDVIWQALTAAGYDLKAMVDADIAAYPEAYPRVGGQPDPNIDFRRVKNLVVFFQRHAASFTTEVRPGDPENLREWQGGDIVFFGPPLDHIAVVSDRRRPDGVPYLLHNAGPYASESDALLAWPTAVTYHFRFPALAEEPAVETGPVARPVGPVPPAVIHYRDKIVVLAYHHLALEETPDEMATLSVTHFREHLDVLQENDYVVVSLVDMENFLQGEEIPPNAVAITFDDGYASFYTAAFPELIKRGMPAAVFPIVSRIGTTWGTPKLTWEEIRELVQQGMEVHSHSYDGHLMGRRGDKEVAVLTGSVYQKELGRVETRQEYRDRVAKDIATAQNLLAVNAGINDTYFSYPYGRSSSGLRQALEEAGYHLAFTFTPAAVTRSSDSLVLPRVNAGGPGTGGKELLELMAEATK